jgi:hypothetical protein
MAIDTVRFQLVLPKWLKDVVSNKADEKGVSMGEYIRDSLKKTIDDDEEKQPAEKD